MSHILIKNFKIKMGIGDWGLGIGDWGLGPIPNPQSPIFFINICDINLFYKIIIFYLKIIING